MHVSRLIRRSLEKIREEIGGDVPIEDARAAPPRRAGLGLRRGRGLRVPDALACLREADRLVRDERGRDGGDERERQRAPERRA